MIQYFVGAPFSFNCPSLNTQYFLVLGQLLHLSITKLLSHFNVSVNSNWVHPPPGQPPGISSKTLPGGSGFDF